MPRDQAQVKRHMLNSRHSVKDIADMLFPGAFVCSVVKAGIRYLLSRARSF